VKSAWRKPNRRGDIDSTVTVKISHCSKLGRVTDAVPLMAAQAAVWINEKDRR
jgi:hypothetical protein